MHLFSHWFVCIDDAIRPIISLYIIIMNIHIIVQIIEQIFIQNPIDILWWIWNDNMAWIGINYAMKVVQFDAPCFIYFYFYNLTFSFVATISFLFAYLIDLSCENSIYLRFLCLLVLSVNVILIIWACLVSQPIFVYGMLAVLI